jgi:hypothetical protein
MNRYMISKGWEGFADRLTALSHCIDIALHYNRILFVDWGDRIWSHDERNFYSYFDLVGVPYVVSAQQIPPDLDTYPKFWKRGLGMPCDEWIYNVKSHVVFDATQRNHHEPVWVHPCIIQRYYDFGRLPNQIRFKPEIAAEIARLIKDVPTDLPVVHLRGTDRVVPEQRWNALHMAAPVAVVVSDDAALVDRWLAESPDSIVVSDTLAPVGDAVIGTHKVDLYTLKNRGLNKHQLNLRLLADFIILARAPDAYAINEKSLFFTMARFFGKCGGVEPIFRPATEAQTFSAYYKGYEFYFRPPEK